MTTEQHKLLIKITAAVFYSNRKPGDKPSENRLNTLKIKFAGVPTQSSNQLKLQRQQKLSSLISLSQRS